MDMRTPLLGGAEPALSRACPARVLILTSFSEPELCAGYAGRRSRFSRDANLDERPRLRARQHGRIDHLRRQRCALMETSAAPRSYLSGLILLNARC